MRHDPSSARALDEPGAPARRQAATTPEPNGLAASRRQRRARWTAAVVLAGAALFGASAPAAADSAPSPSASGGPGEEGEPTEAGTGFRTATAIRPGGKATAVASTGDYLYWAVPVAAGQTATAEATVTLPESQARHGEATWQLDVFDGLRRRQACTAGPQTQTASAEEQSVTLRCTLRTVRSWAQPWSNDPLPGAYYLRLTVSDVPEQDLGLPVRAEVGAEVADEGGSLAVGGSVEPLNPLLRTGATAAGDASEAPETGEPEREDGQEENSGPPYRAVAGPDGGWSGWWSGRWLWTGAGGVLAALAGIAGFRLARGPRVPR